MSPEPPIYMHPLPEFRSGSESLWFWVPAEGGSAVRAIVSRGVLHDQFKGKLDGSAAPSVYAAHRRLIDAAFLRRIEAGAREPVVLRAQDVSSLKG